jgi:hypothetical protein
MTQPNNQRRHLRLPGRAEITLINPHGESRYLTENFSLGGVFVRTDTPKPLRHLVKVRFSPPGHRGDPLQMLAMVVYIVSPEQATRLHRAPGMGLNLYGLDDDTRLRWADFIDAAQQRVQALGALPEHRPALPAEPIRRRDPRTTAEFKVQLQTAAQLLEVYTCDISLGGTFLRAQHLPDDGEPVRLLFIHPDDGSEHPLRARVVRRLQHPDPGLGLAFDDMDHDARQRFRDFIESGLPILDSDEDLIVESGDPLLE